RVIHAQPRQLERLLVVTSEFHLPRTELIFRWVYGLKGPAIPFELTFMSSPNDGIGEADLQARLDRERSGIGRLRPLAARIGTVKSFHTWLYTAHGGYRFPSTIDRAGERALNTY